MTTILSQTWEVRNEIGTLLATYSDEALARSKAKFLVREFGNLTIQHVTVSEERVTVRKVRKPVERAA